MKHIRLIFPFVAILTLCVNACGDNYSDPSNVSISFNDVSAVELHTDLQKGLLTSEDPDSYIALHSDELGEFSNSSPNKVKVTYTIDSENIVPKNIYVSVSEKQDMSEPMRFNGDDKEAYIYNMKSGTTYYYQVVAKYVKELASEVKSFTVNAGAPRNIEVDGVENVRDLGGWNIGEGKVFKQGLIYRSAQFNYGGKYNDYVSEPTELGRKVLLDDLKIKTDIDLRRNIEHNDGYDEVNGITSSPLGDNVNYVAASMVYGGKNVFALPENKTALKLFFETLSDENNYPVVFHCLRGTDRTGALAYMIGALVGMNEQDLLKDYLFSNFGKIGSLVRRSTISSLFVRGISLSEGDTYQEKAANYLMANVDVSMETINKIRNILVG